MKKVLIIALSLFSVTAFAGNSHNDLNGDLNQKATAEGMTTDQSVHGASADDFEFHSVLDRKENRRRASY